MRTSMVDFLASMPKDNFVDGNDDDNNSCSSRKETRGSYMRDLTEKNAATAKRKRQQFTKKFAGKAEALKTSGGPSRTDTQTNLVTSIQWWWEAEVSYSATTVKSQRDRQAAGKDARQCTIIYSAYIPKEGSMKTLFSLAHTGAATPVRLKSPRTFLQFSSELGLGKIAWA